MNEDGKDVKYVCVLIRAYGRSKHVLEANQGTMVTFECLEMKLEKTTKF